MGEQVAADGGSRADRGFGREVLGGEGEGKSHYAKEDQKPSHFPQVGAVVSVDAHVDHLSHHQGNEELESGLQHFKKRGQYGDDRMGFQIAK